MSPSFLLLLITGCLALQPLSTDLYLPSLPHMATAFGVGPDAVQHTLSLFVLGFGGAQLISGPLSDRYGRRPVLLGGLATYAAASLACAVAPSLTLLVAGRFVQALGCCTAVVVARAIIRDAYSPAEGARVIAKASSLLAIAPLFGPILGGYLQVSFGWRAAFVVLTAFGLLVMVAAALRQQETNLRPNPRATEPRQLLGIYGQVIRTPAFWAYTLPGSLSYAAIFVFISASSFVLIRVLGVGTERYGMLYAVGVLGYLGGTLVCRQMLPGRGMARTLAFGTLLGAVGGATFLALVWAGVSHWSLVVAAQFVTMGSHGINFPCAQAGSVAPFPQQAGAAAGLFGALAMVAALGAGIWIGSHHDGTLMPLAIATFAVTGTLYVTTRLLRPHAGG